MFPIFRDDKVVLPSHTAWLKTHLVAASSSWLLCVFPFLAFSTALQQHHDPLLPAADLPFQAFNRSEYSLLKQFVKAFGDIHWLLEVCQKKR